MPENPYVAPHEREPEDSRDHVGWERFSVIGIILFAAGVLLLSMSMQRWIAVILRRHIGERVLFAFQGIGTISVLFGASTLIVVSLYWLAAKCSSCWLKQPKRGENSGGATDGRANEGNRSNP